MWLIIARILAGFAPGTAVFDYPISQGAFESNIMSGLFRLNPFVPKDFLPLGLELAV